jgi:hypothetical protein
MNLIPGLKWGLKVVHRNGENFLDKKSFLKLFKNVKNEHFQVTFG